MWNRRKLKFPIRRFQFTVKISAPFIVTNQADKFRRICREHNFIEDIVISSGGNGHIQRCETICKHFISRRYAVSKISAVLEIKPNRIEVEASLNKLSC